LTSLSPVLKVENLCIELADFTLHADFFVQAGERVVLWGPSGSGKSTLLRVIAGLEIAGLKKSGTLFMGEKNLTRLPPQARDIGFVFQDQVLFPNLSVLDNAAFGLKMRGVGREKREDEARSWLGRVGLGPRADASVEQLSVGERQRVAFIRALIWKPRLILLDEPFSALDPGLRASMRSELLELHRLSQAPLILVTHDQVDVESIGQCKIELQLKSDSRERWVRRLA
jgi:ABC-type sugar transport system ATPase subunit